MWPLLVFLYNVGMCEATCPHRLTLQCATERRAGRHHQLSKTLPYPRKPSWDSLLLNQSPEDLEDHTHLEAVGPVGPRY